MKNVDKAFPAVLVEIGGEERKLEYTMYSAIQLLKLTGKNVMKGEIDYADPMQIVPLVWAGLISTCPELDGDVDADTKKPDQKAADGILKVSKWIKFDRLKHVSAAIARAFGQASPGKPAEAEGKKDGPEAGEVPADPNGTSSTSSVSVASH